MDKKAKIYIAGHRGLVGSALERKLRQEGFTNLLLRTSKELDLRRQQDVEIFFERERPEYVFLAAAKVGGILANNTYKAEFIYDNIFIGSNVIHAAYKFRVKKLLNLGSSCIYPKFSPQPMKEEHLLTGSARTDERTLRYRQNRRDQALPVLQRAVRHGFSLAMPTNLYGPNDNFDLETSHVLPALIRKFHEAKVSDAGAVTIWGSGEPYREFLYVDDLAAACVYLMKKYHSADVGEFVNIGTGKDITIKDLAQTIRDIVGFKGEIRHDRSKPDGTPKKLLDISRMRALGWEPKIELEEGIRKSYQWYLENSGRS